MLGADTAAALREACVSLMAEVTATLIETADGKRRIIPALWPDEDSHDHGVRGDLSEFAVCGRRNWKPLPGRSIPRRGSSTLSRR